MYCSINEICELHYNIDRLRICSIIYYLVSLILYSKVFVEIMSINIGINISFYIGLQNRMFLFNW